MTPSNNFTLWPGDWATLILASDDLMPRQRARDQQADLTGAELKRNLLARLIEFDPPPPELTETLHKIVVELGEPHGPARAIAVTLREEFDAAAAHPELVAWLMECAAARSHPKCSTDAGPARE